MTLPEKRRRQILDDYTEEARFDARETSAPRNGRVQEDSWVSGFIGRLAALLRDVGGREK